MNSEHTATPYADLLRALNKAAIITETDLDGRITFVNAEFCRISGYSETELLGESHSIVNSNTHSKKLFTEMWKTITGGEVWFGEICNRAKDGHLYWLQAIILPIFSEETGEVYKYAAIRFDITERKTQELALKKKAALYQAAIETTDGFARLNMKGNFIEVSDTYCAMTGYSREELLCMSIDELDATENPIERLENFNRVLLGHGNTFEVKRRRKNGSHWSTEITATYTPLDNGSIFVFLHDITERKAMEKYNNELQRQLNHSQKLDSIGRLAAGISHDFNNILSSIIGYNELCKMIAEEELAESEVKNNLIANLKHVSSSGERAAELIAQMLTYCRQEPILSKKAISIKPTRSVIEEVVNMVNVNLPAGIKIELELNDTPDIAIDSMELHQILTNLVVNARDAIKKMGGVIKIKLSTIEMSDARCTACLTWINGRFIELCVSDCGMGINDETMEHIFDPFFTTKAIGEGTGLGLAMVSGIMKNLGGHILVDSKLGVGTTFRLFFPFPKNES